jgi:hypothetical protein
MRPYFLVEDCFRFGRNHHPERYPFTTTLPGLTPAHWWCADILAIVRQTAEQLTEGNYGLFVTRDAMTGEKTGYAFGANDQAIVGRVRFVYVQARLRAEQVRR